MRGGGIEPWVRHCLCCKLAGCARARIEITPMLGPSIRVTDGLTIHSLACRPTTGQRRSSGGAEWMPDSSSDCYGRDLDTVRRTLVGQAPLAARSFAPCPLPTFDQFTKLVACCPTIQSVDSRFCMLPFVFWRAVVFDLLQLDHQHRHLV